MIKQLERMARVVLVLYSVLLASFAPCAQTRGLGQAMRDRKIAELKYWLSQSEGSFINSLKASSRSTAENPLHLCKLVLFGKATDLTSQEAMLLFLWKMDVAEELPDFGRRADPVVRRALLDGDAQTRTAGIEAVVAIGWRDPSDADQFCSFLPKLKADRDGMVRAHALRLEDIHPSTVPKPPT